MPSPSVRVRNQSAPDVELMWHKVIIKGQEPQLSKIAEIKQDGMKKISGWKLHDSSTKNLVPHTIGVYVGGVLKVVVYPAEIVPCAEIIIRMEGNEITVWGLKQTLSNLLFGGGGCWPTRSRGRGDDENLRVRIGLNQPPPLENAGVILPRVPYVLIADLNPLSPRSTLATFSSLSSDVVIRSASSPSSPLSAFATPTAYASPCSDVEIRSASSYWSPLSTFGTSTAYASPCSDV